ncbi:MAG: Fic family protein [Planctomycetota bacterium]|jgi:Fic family protein
MDFTKLDQLKEQLDTHRPLDSAVLENLHQELVLEWTYNSNAIEGNTLTLKETKVALEGVTIGGKSLREHFEAINHQQAIGYVEKLVAENEPLGQWQIKNLHQLILKNIDDDHAGVYRRSNVTIAGADHVPCDFTQVAEQMDAFIAWYNQQATALHPVERAARIHCDFVKIHPFVDGNGRTSRLLMNLELMKAGFPAAVLPVTQRLEYYQTLDGAHVNNEYQPFIELISGIVENSFKPYWFALGIEP